MEKTLLNNFHFNSDQYGQIIWGWDDECVHEANNHKTFKPKISDLIIKSELPAKDKTIVRKELFDDLLLDDKPKEKPKGIFANRK
ncbi:MAG TPA: hypothetical protein DEG69_10985 [Flavobacteriaceae bacterium]|nr:hypothetical protein [Flavobacteriaceae bacterium]